VLVARVSVADRIAHLRRLLRKAAELSFEDAVGGADRMTVAVTLYALLELYKRGEVSWQQAEPFGEITVRAAASPPAAARAGRP
jgi:segregation and condensation protein A